MIPKDKDLRKQMIERMLSYCMQDREDKLNSWENDFVISINNQYEHKKDLSDKQCGILEKIYDKI